MTRNYICPVLALAVATMLAAPRADADLAIAGNLLVDLRADHATAGTATWTNLGTLGGLFFEVGNASVMTASGVSYVHFDANEAYRGPTAPASVTGASDRTIEAWVLNANIALRDTITAWGHRGGPGRDNMAFNYGSDANDGAADHWPDFSGGSLGWGVAGTPVANTLHHLVYTYDGTTVNVYADGVLKNSEATALNTHALLTDTINLMAQNNAAGGLEWVTQDGMDVAVLRIHDGALSAAGVLNNFNEGPVAVPESRWAGAVAAAVSGLVALFCKKR